jgi:hypothetical protein
VLNLVVRCWCYWEVVETLGGDGLVGRIRSRSTCPWRVYFILKLFSLLPRHYKLKSFAPLHAVHMMAYVVTELKAMEPACYELKPLKPWAKTTFFSLSWFSHVCCHSDSSWLSHVPTVCHSENGSGGIGYVELSRCFSRSGKSLRVYLSFLLSTVFRCDYRSLSKSLNKSSFHF